MKVVSFDGHLINDGDEYKAGLTADGQSLPSAEPVFVRRNGVRPLVGALTYGGVLKVLEVHLPTSGTLTKRARQVQLFQWFDNTSVTAKQLIVADDDGLSNRRYWMAVPISVAALAGGDGWKYEVVLAVHGDVRTRKVAAATDSWAITATGQTKTITNGGDDIAFPVLDITPTAVKSGSSAYKRWLPIRWRVETAVSRYPVDVVDTFDTAALVTAGKMQADGDDLRIEVDGVEANRWLGVMNTTLTRVWCNFDFVAQETAGLSAAMLSGDTVDTLDVTDAVTGFPSAGILLIGSEAFTYTGKNDSLKRFTGVSRAQKGTTAGGHSAAASVEWIQHDVWMTYGNATATAPSTDNTNKPIFDVDTSTNTLWKYADFGTSGGARAAEWAQTGLSGNLDYWFNSPRPDLRFYAEQDFFGVVYSGSGRYSLSNPCEITNANFSGTKQADVLASWASASIRSYDGSSETTAYTIPAPTVAGASQAWSRSEALGSGATEVRLFFADGLPSGGGVYTVQFSGNNADITLNSSNTPSLTVSSEQDNYQLATTLVNETTGESIAITYTMGLGETIQVDTDLKTVVDMDDGSSQFQAIALVGGVRLHWLKLLTGENVLQWDDAGTAGVTVGIEWEERGYN